MGSILSFQKVDQLLLGKLFESTSMTATSLISLVQLLDKVKNMVISDHIQREVRVSTTSQLLTESLLLHASSSKGRVFLTVHPRSE